MAKAKLFVQLYLLFQEWKAQAIVEHVNSNVLNILPLTTLRTIDLEGKKIPRPFVF